MYPLHLYNILTFLVSLQHTKRSAAVCNLVAELDAVELVCMFKKFRSERRRNELSVIGQLMDHI